ncbi:MAG: methyl-accepting chemotaxis protein, partial [Thermodesulfobacteriota bacterium]|nr:methyl-accepting chemotaxis protein [Thermodesulfobacteriota bacterium]
MRFLVLKTIRSRIIALAGLGVLGMCVIVMTGYVIGARSKDDVLTRQYAQNARQETLRMIMDEQGFLNTHDMDTYSRCLEDNRGIAETISGISAISCDTRITGLADEITSGLKRHEEVFNTLHGNVVLLDKARKNIRIAFDGMETHVKKIVDKINQEEFQAMMMGGQLDSNRGNLRREAKDFLRFGNERFLNIQDLLLFSDLVAYEKTKKAMEKEFGLSVKNTEVVLGAVGSAAFNKEWKQAMEGLNRANELETSMLKAWKRNKVLNVELKETADHIEASTLEIFNVSGANEARLKKTGNTVQYLVALVAIILLGLFAFIIIKGILKPLMHTIIMLKDIAQGEGDLTSRLEVDKGSEIGEMARWFNAFIEKLEGIIRDITRGVETLSTSSAGLSG